MEVVHGTSGLGLGALLVWVLQMVIGILSGF
jgi:hypothetical protein